MTTPDPSDEQRTSEPAQPGSHSAPRPVPPIDPLPGDPDGERSPGRSAAPAFGATPATAPEDPSEPATAPARVSAFGDTRESTEAPETSDRAAQAATTPIPVAPEVTTTQVVPAGPAQTAAPQATQPGALAGSAAGQLSSYEREPVPDPEWEEEKPTKRTSTHLWGILATFALAPITWFLLTDGALRTFYSLQNVGDSPNLAGLLSLAGGLIGLFIIALVARSLSLGTWIWGGIIAAAGATFLIIPATLMQWMVDSRETFLTLNEGFGTNLYNYLLDTGRSGLLLTFGVILLLLAMVSHSSRRRGRNEERIRARAEAQTPSH